LIGEILSRVAQAEILPRLGALTAEQVREKSSRFDVATDADEAAEHAISVALETAYPGAVIVGEEASASPWHVGR
jgi:fructose-1,6-bisphosphatase/inositol monophosphatase family enzyme